MKEKRAYRGAMQRELKAWGDIITADHVDSSRKELMGIGGEKEAMTIRDLFSGLTHFYPMNDKATASTVTAMKLFIGDRKVKLF